MARSEDPDRGNRPVTIFDVARLAGVSHQTVSRVINDSPNVRDETRARVRKAIAQLRYEPSPAARALVTRRTRTIGLIAPSSADYGPASIQLHFNAAAHAARYNVFTTSVDSGDPSAARTAIESLLRQGVEAVVLVLLDVGTLEALRGLEVGAPIVLIAAGMSRGVHAVAIDQYGGARTAVRHLLDSGYLDVIHIGGPLDHPDARERVRGWADELAAAGMPRGELQYAAWTAAAGRAIGLDLTVIPGRTAVFAGNDQIALGLMSALALRRLDVPGEVGVIGFDDLPEAAFYSPPLTTIRQDFEALGQLAFRRVLDAIDGSEAAQPAPIPASLVIRASSVSRSDFLTGTRGAPSIPALPERQEQAAPVSQRTGSTRT